jgi:ankyrin repeat protein
MKASFFKARTALHYAARAGCAEALAAVIEVASHHQGTGLVHFLNLPDYHGDTALALACKHGCVCYTWTYANNRLCALGQPAWLACTLQQPPHVLFFCKTAARNVHSLLAFGRASNALCSASTLAPCCARLPPPCRHPSCLRELLEAGASPLPANSHGFTALHHAAVRGHAACMRLILSSHIRLSGEYTQQQANLCI